MIQTNDISITDATRMEWFPVISLQENSLKLYHPCEVIPCNITNYLIRRQSERYIIKTIIAISTEIKIFKLKKIIIQLPWFKLMKSLFVKAVPQD